MKNISRTYIIVGLISIGLSISGLFLYPEYKGYNLPFQLLMISLQCGAIAIPESKFVILIKTLQLPFFDYIFSIVLVVSGIGTILTKRWGRTFAHIYSISLIFLSVIGIPVILIGYIRELSAIYKYGFLSGLIWGGVLVYIVALFGALLYPVILLIFFSRLKIKEKFRGKKLLLQE